MNRLIMKTGAILLAISVLLGAFGAHLLKDFISSSLLETYKIAVQYHMIHSLALVMTGYIYRHYHNKKVLRANYAFMLGILLFSGSLYGMVLTTAAGGVFPTILNLVTPVGGALFVIGWTLFFLGIPARDKYDKKDHQEE